MKPIKFDGHNKVFGKPIEMTDEECGSLVVNNNGRVSWSCWELDEADIKEILESKKIWLGVWAGKQHPPVSLNTEEPIEVTNTRLKRDN